MYSTYQNALFDEVENGKGNIIVQARAGSGKTFSALHSISRMKGDVIALMFGKKNAVEMQQKIAAMNLIHAKGSTFHSEGMNNYMKAQKAQVQTSKVYFMSEIYCNTPQTSSARMFVNRMVGMAKQSGFGIPGCPSPDDFDSWMDIVSHHDISLDAEMSYDDAFDICRKLLADSNREYRQIDFDDMIYLPLLKNLPLRKYDWVILDEAQDTNAVRKIFAQRIMHENSRLLAIGDDKQSIMGFTGAENDSMNIIKETFQCKELALPVCYRCGVNIIKKAQEIVPDILPHDNAPEGMIVEKTYDDFLKIVPELNLNRNDGIICRNNAPLVSLAFNLIRQGIGCRIEGRDIGKNLITFCNKWKVKDLATFTNRLVQFFEREFAKQNNKAKMQLLEDKMETMIILIQRCQSLGKHDVASLKNLIEGMFSDSVEANIPNVVVLSSVHKSKGLEFDRCYLLGQNQFIPSKYAVQAWQKEQEENLKYVAITRAKHELVFITDVPTRSNNNPSEG